MRRLYDWPQWGGYNIKIASTKAIIEVSAQVSKKTISCTKKISDTMGETYSVIELIVG